MQCAQLIKLRLRMTEDYGGYFKNIWNPDLTLAPRRMISNWVSGIFENGESFLDIVDSFFFFGLKVKLGYSERVTLK